jgi:hypothetical protein
MKEASHSMGHSGGHSHQRPGHQLGCLDGAAGGGSRFKAASRMDSTELSDQRVRRTVVGWPSSALRGTEPPLCRVCPARPGSFLALIAHERACKTFQTDCGMVHTIYKYHSEIVPGSSPANSINP